MFNSIAFLNTLLWTLAPSLLYAIVLLFVDPKRPKLLHMSSVCNYSKKERLAEKPILPGNGSLRLVRKV
jgi:hypothetical protein